VFDAIVIGAGAGGLCAAARLSHLGYRTLVSESRDRVGGRASTYDLDGFKINEGAVVLEVGSFLEYTCREVGATFDVREPAPRIVYRISGMNIDVTSRGFGFLLSKLTQRGAKLLENMAAAKTDDGALPDEQVSVAQWVSRYTKNERVHALMHNIGANIFAVNADELPARVFLTYLTRTSATKKFGFCPEGTIGPFRSLAEVVSRNGGEVRLGARACSIRVTDNQVRGVVIDSGRGTTTVSAPIVLSDIGPAATLKLLDPQSVPDAYAREVQDSDRPCAMISVNFASKEALVEWPGLVSFGLTRRLCYVANFTATCPEMAPDGWHLYVAAGVPRPSVGTFDDEQETALLIEDLRDHIRDFDSAKILSIAVTRDDWPPQRSVAGYDLPSDTPISGLWNLGDGVKEYGSGGTTACAETAKIVVDKVLKHHPLEVRAHRETVVE
jgi:phytoene dehydrogenase-like protein